MKKKIFTLLTLLVACVTGAWADAITVTWLPNNMASITTAGTASVTNILTVNDLTYSSDVNAPVLATVGEEKCGNFIPKTAAGKNYYSKDDYVTFSVTVASGYNFFPTSATAKVSGAGTGDNGAQIFATVQTENGSNAIANSGKDPNTTNLSLTSFSSSTIEGGQTLYFYIHIGTRGNTDPYKGVDIRDVVLTGTYESATMTKLSTPEITVNQATGQVTIGSVANATKVTYTTDGTDPTASSTTYSTPFTIDANCTIKAIAIGDGESYSNSNIASQAANITVENPVLTAHNGTVGITCATDGATIKYSTDNETWTDYSHPLTYFSNTTVYAKAEHASYKNNSGTVNLAISAAPAATAGSQTKILQWVTPGENNWEYMSGDNGNGGTTNYGIQGKADTEDEGWSLWISPNGSGYYDKALSWATNTTTIDDVVYSFMKNSNGRQFNIGMPSNLRANRITIYSYNVPADQSTIWSTVGGSTYTTDTEVSIISSNNESPEIRVFSLDDVADNIILNNAGYQQCFMAVVDYTVYVPGPADQQDITEEGTVTETVTFTKSSSTTNYVVSPNIMPSVIAIASPNYKETSLDGYAGALELGSSTTITIALPSGATDASVTLVDEASTDKKLKVDGTDDTSRTWSGDAENGYSTTINIPDSKAGKNFVIAKKDAGTKIVKITLTYTYDIPTGDITLTTTTNMAGWRAFYDASNSYSVDANTKVYVADTDPVGTTITLKAIEGIPANVPVILHTSSSADSYKMTLTKETASPFSYTGTNKLEYTTSAVDQKYRLGYGASGIGFYPYSGTPSSGAVILNVSSAAAAPTLTLDFGNSTGINTVNGSELKVNGEYYNLAGQRVANPIKGLYIVNGKKVIVK